MPRRMSPARTAAKERGDTFYTGPACKFGHVGERYTSTNACRECVRRQTRPDRARKPKADEFDQLLGEAR